MAARRFAMLVSLVAAAVTGAGCGSLKPADGLDGGPIDAPVDGPSQARVCDPDRPMPAEPTTAGSMQGSWRVDWVCTHGCALRRPGLTYSPGLEVVGATLLWSNPMCEECRAIAFGQVSIGGCIDVGSYADFDSQCRFSYRICEMQGELHGSVTWKEPGVSPTTWQLVGTRDRGL